MPKDNWRKARDRSVARQAALDYARSEGRSSYSYAWSDSDPAPLIGSRPSAGPKKQPKQEAATPGSCPYCRCHARRMKRHIARCPKRQAKLRKRKRKAVQAGTKLGKEPVLTKKGVTKPAGTKVQSTLGSARDQATPLIPAGFAMPEDPALRGVSKGRKFQEPDGSWVLATKRGREIKRFPTETELDDWWLAFQLMQGHEPKQLSVTVP